MQMKEHHRNLGGIMQMKEHHRNLGGIMQMKEHQANILNTAHSIGGMIQVKVCE